MEMEFTAKQVEISKALRARLRKQAEDGMKRIARILGKTARASVIFSTQKRQQIVEVTVQVRTQTFAATGDSAAWDASLREAIERVESQVVRYRDRRLESKRLPKEEKVPTAPPITPRSKTRTAKAEAAAAVRKPTRAKPRAPIVGDLSHLPPQVAEPHVLTTGEAFALDPLTAEEAVVELQFRDRDLLIFHDPDDALFVLHRRRDGKMELVEIP
jgi:putative sigma-54 modulation protein